MSVILDALRKLDHERSSRRSGRPNIAAEIVRADPPRPKKKILLYFIAVSIASAAITYLVMAEFGLLSKSSPPTTVNSPSSNHLLPSTSSEVASPSESLGPTLTKPLASTHQASPARSVPALSKPSPPIAGTPAAQEKSPEPVHDSPGETKLATQKPESSAEEKTLSGSPVEKERNNQVVSEEAKVAPADTIRLPEQTLDLSPTTPLSLRISGIIWSEEPSKRMAVINGGTFTEGSVVEGAKVVEIHRARVRFLHNNRFLEIPLGVSYTLD